MIRTQASPFHKNQWFLSHFGKGVGMVVRENGFYRHIPTLGYSQNLLPGEFETMDEFLIALGQRLNFKFPIVRGNITVDVMIEAPNMWKVFLTRDKTVAHIGNIVLINHFYTFISNTRGPGKSVESLNEAIDLLV